MASSPSRVGELRLKAESSHGATIAVASTYWADSPNYLRAWDIDVGSLKYTSEDDPSPAIGHRCG